MPKQKFIAHIDMDAFFAAIEQRDNPSLRGKPVVIGADPKAGKGRGVVSTCSYEARAFGIHSAMPISIAYRKCSKAEFISPNMEKYAQVSRKIFKIMYDFTPAIEIVSIDEAFLDLTGSYHLFKTPENACKMLKAKIKEQLGLTASIGLAPIKTAAKIASDLDKPDGFVKVTSVGLIDFLWPLDVGKIWGLGNKSKVILNNMGIKTIGDLANMDLKILDKAFGKNAYHWKALANGIDDREVEPCLETKSVGNEITFSQDTNKRSKIESALIGLCEKVSSRLRGQFLKGRTITLKIRLQGFDTYTRAVTLSKATNFSDIIYKAIIMLLDKFSSNDKKVRLLGVKVTNLMDSDIRDSLFVGEADSKKENIHTAVDKIKAQFGYEAIHRAGSMDF